MPEDIHLDQLPGEFIDALASLRSARYRPEVQVREIPAPRSLAPFAVALEGSVLDEPRHPVLRVVDDTDDAPGLEEEQSALALGRFVVLYDPEPQTAWGGKFRVITYIRADSQRAPWNPGSEGHVAWSWLASNLDRRQARQHHLGGTVTTALSESFGVIGHRADTLDVEIRASWTPVGTDLQTHLEAWAAVLCDAAGIPDVPDGVTPLPLTRRFKP